MRSKPRSSNDLSRREFVGASALMAAATLRSPAPPSPGPPDDDLEAKYRDNIYTRLLGVRPHLPAHEHISRLGGGRMDSVVLAAMTEANDLFVDMNELNLAAGKKIAAMIGAEAALVTCGGFSAMVLGAAACLTGTDQARIDALPAVSWPRRDCLIHSAHRFDYERAYQLAGATLVEAANRDQFRAKLGPTTAFVAALAAAEKQVGFAPPPPVKRVKRPDPSQMTIEQQIADAHGAGVPVLVDMASDLPPRSNLRRFLAAGADLITVSGGKGIGGPQGSGILAGRADLVEAARHNLSPFTAIGRGMKVARENIVGLVVALERYLADDEGARLAGWRRKAELILSELRGIEGLRLEVGPNVMGYYDVDLDWDPSKIRLTVDQLKDRLKQGDPPVVFDGTTIRTRCLRDGEERLVAKRLAQVFRSAA